VSDDGRRGLTLISFVGSVFSPYYAWSGRGDPLDHCAVNVALHGTGGRRWAMTERRRSALARDETTLTIGPSRLAWADGALTVRFDEITAPAPSRLRGSVRLRPLAVNRQAWALDAAGRHLWRAIAPRAAVDVTLDSPPGAWRGQGYFDTNSGEEPLEDGFDGWDWSRADLAAETRLFYDVVRRGGEAASLALAFGRDGRPRTIAAPPPTRLPATGWRIARTARGETAPPRLVETILDTPFYARSALTAGYGGETARVMHETLALDRLRSPIVRAMLPFRMPRVLW
jgi:carotenoid 1,2-hydratase